MAHPESRPPARAVRPFEIAVPGPVLDDLRARLRSTRLPSGLSTGWSAGTDAAYLRSFVSSWASDYDWRQTESGLNALGQKLVEVDGVRIHVFHIRAPTSDSTPVPLVLTHGWPSSFFEFLGLVGPLSDPVAHGASNADAFDLVIPSLPGFGFSDRLPAGESHPARIAELWAGVMERLGYDRFGAYGGDIGSQVTNFLGAAHPEQTLGVFTHHPNLHPDITDDRPLTDTELTYLKRHRDTADERDSSYAEVQSSRPDSLAPALNDSPAGLAAWILDKYRDWTDSDGKVESVISRQTLLDIATLYWVTESIGTSFLTYLDDLNTPRLPAVTVPAGLTLTPEDADYPRAFAERTYTDIRLWRGPGRGGHFLALERPQRLVADLRDFFGPLRAG